QQLDLFGMATKENDQPEVGETVAQPVDIPGFPGPPLPPRTPDREEDISGTQEAPAELQTSDVAPPPSPVKKKGRKSFREIDAELGLVEIPEDEILFQKQYYSISQVAQWFRVNTSLL